MTVLVHVSDTHFGTERPEVVKALVEFVNECRPTVVVLSGDITQRARRAQFFAARSFCESIAAPVLAIPGNHDLPLFDPLARLLWPYANYQEAFGDDLEPEFSSRTLLVMCLNTTRARRRKNGEVSRDQVARVAARLRLARPEQLRVVVTHQPVHVITAHDVDNLLIGHDLLIRACAEAGADVLMGGHIHLPYVRPLEHAEGLPRRTWVVQAGTAVSRRTRGGIDNSVNVLSYAEGTATCRVERHDFGNGAFQPVEHTTLRLDRTSTEREGPRDRPP